jgi:hypothetical protein|tara:strand:- start:209 stop:418 length:210 start_codon:yes stop_codon:yes gene_type:complete
MKIYVIKKERRKKMMTDIGNKCVSCFKDTSFGSGRFINRIVAGTYEYEGYQCSECQVTDPEFKKERGKK